MDITYDVIQNGAENADSRRKNLQKKAPLKPQDTQNYELLRPCLVEHNKQIILCFSVNDCGVPPALFSDAHLTLGGLVVGKISILEVDAGTRVLWLMKLVSYVIIEDF